MPARSRIRIPRCRRVPWGGILLALALAVPQIGLAQPPVEVGNSVYRVQVQTEGSSIGSWNARLAPGHEAFDASESPQELLFQLDQTDTNFSTLRVYTTQGEEDFPFGDARDGSGSLDDFVVSHGSSLFAPEGRGLRTTWRLEIEELEDLRLQVTQDVFIVGTTTANSAIYHTVRVHNVGDSPVRIGWRNLYDWSFGGRSLDDPINTFEAECGDVLGDPVSDEEAEAPAGTRSVRLSREGRSYEILLSLESDPRLSTLAVTPPDQYGFVEWTAGFTKAFDYDLDAGAVTDSAGMSWFGKTRETARKIEANGSVQFTQVLFAVPPDGCIEPCAELRRTSEVLCTRDGSGDVTLDLIVRNLTQEPIHHLFVFDNDPDSGVEIVEDYVNFPERFGSPLGVQGDPASGAPFRPLSFKIKGATPGQPLSLLFTFHNEDLEMCCSQELVIDVPECDCAQVRSLRTCPAFMENRPQSFTFYLDNLSEEEVHHVFITPVDPPDAVFTPNHFRAPVDFPAPLQPGQTAGSFAVTVEGPNVHPGSEIEFRVSIHDENVRECCPAQTKRVVLPAACQPVSCDAVGGATSHFFRGRFVVGDISSERPFFDGYTCHFLDPVAFEAAWLPFDHAAEPTSGAGFEVTAEGVTDGGTVRELGTVRTVLEGEDLVIGADLTPIDSPTQRIEVYRQNELVGVVSGNTGELRVSRRDGELWPTRLGKLGGLGQTTCYVQEWDDLVHFLGTGLAGGLVGDELRILAETEEQASPGLETFTFRAAGIPEVVVTEATQIFDCNGNGVPDRLDLESGASADADADGIPDECRPGDEPVAILNTGFDETSGSVLPEGAPDGGWQVVSPQPPRAASVVSSPVGAWPDPLPDSRWISADPDRGRSAPGVAVSDYERCFCLAAGASDPFLGLRLWADDRATVFLNGGVVAGPGGRFSLAPLEVAVSDPGLFREGENCVLVRVEDPGGFVTGLNLEGVVTATDGRCPAP